MIKPVMGAAIRALTDTFRDAGINPGSPAATSRSASILRARNGNEVLEAQPAKVRMER